MHISVTEDDLATPEPIAAALNRASESPDDWWVSSQYCWRTGCMAWNDQRKEYQWRMRGGLYPLPPRAVDFQAGVFREPFEFDIDCEADFDGSPKPLTPYYRGPYG